MSREIKFRAWDNVEWVMYDNHSVCLQIDGTVSFLNRSGEWEKDDDKSLIELMQYTGLKDKNGTDIYEGDILERIGTRDNFTTTPFDTRLRELVVVFIEVIKDEFGKQSVGFTMNTERSYSERGNPATYEVIGNIYETPHLLNPSPEPLNDGQNSNH